MTRREVVELLYDACAEYAHRAGYDVAEICYRPLRLGDKNGDMSFPVRFDIDELDAKRDNILDENTEIYCLYYKKGEQARSNMVLDARITGDKNDIDYGNVTVTITRTQAGHYDNVGRLMYGDGIRDENGDVVHNGVFNYVGEQKTEVHDLVAEFVNYCLQPYINEQQNENNGFEDYVEDTDIGDR